jgi:HK97 family phage prohead protease
MKFEHKSFAFAPVPQHKSTGKPANSLTGIASTFGGKPDLQGDIIHREAFDGSLLRFKAGISRPQFLLMHRADELPIGKINRLESVTANQLPPSIRQKGADGGLLVEAEYFNSPAGKAALEAARAGVLSLSIGFVTVASSDVRLDGKTVRQLDIIDLREISVVTFAANTLAAANIAVAKALPVKRPGRMALNRQRLAALQQDVERLTAPRLTPADRARQMKLNAARLDRLKLESSGL